MTADIDLIRKLYEEWPRAAETGDIERYLSFLTEDVQLMPPNESEMRGKQAYGSYLTAAFGQASFQITLDAPERIEICDNWAFAKYHVSVSGAPKGGGESFQMDRKCLDILQKQPDGSWKVHIHMWNDNPV
jgi:uncharacterized protein (TIGR02246 family)